MFRGMRGAGRDGGKTKADMPFFQLLRKTFPYIWTRNNWFLRATLITSLFFLICGSVGKLIVPITLKYAIDEMSPPNPSFPLVPILLYGLTSFLSTTCDQARDIFYAYVSSNTERLVALETFEHLQRLSLQYHLKRETGSVLRSVSRGSSSFAGLMRIVLFQIFPVFVQVFIVCVYLFTRYSWYYGLVTMAVIIVYFTFTLTTTEWRDKYRRVMNQKDNEFNQKATDALLNFETVKYFCAESHEQSRYDHALQEYTAANIRSQQTLAVLNSGQQLVIVCGVVSAMALAAKQVVDGEVTTGDFVMLYQFILTLYTPLGFLGTYYRMIKQSMVDVESMVLLWQEKPDIKDPSDAIDLQLYNAAPEIRFESVSFSYGNGVPILKDISFTVKPGQKVAIVGASGAGKSTIVRLLYRFYDTSSGRILVDGQDISQVRQQSLRQEIAIVPQDCVLFNDTIAYNVGYGAFAKSEMGASHDQVVDAAKSAQLDAFIARQPKQYETKVGERGLRLSGGEKQRVAIARAILKRPSIMLFDEATSSLDSSTEASIQSALDSVAQGRTTITIAHRLSTIMNADQIIVLDKGLVVESGRHEELLALAGLYATMWNRQAKTRELEMDLSRLAKEEKEHAEKQKREGEGDGDEDGEETEQEADGSGVTIKIVLDEEEEKKASDTVAPSLPDSSSDRALSTSSSHAPPIQSSSRSGSRHSSRRSSRSDSSHMFGVPQPTEAATETLNERLLDEEAIGDSDADAVANSSS